MKIIVNFKAIQGKITKNQFETFLHLKN